MSRTRSNICPAWSSANAISATPRRRSRRAPRAWASSARSLIYADGALLSALIGNNNTRASPRWSAGQPAGDRADRRALRPVFRGLSRQFDRRGGQHHHAPARRVRGTVNARHQRPELRPIRHAPDAAEPISSARRSATASGRWRCSRSNDHVDSRRPAARLRHRRPARRRQAGRHARRPAASTTSTAPASRSACSARAGSSIRCRTGSS